MLIVYHNELNAGHSWHVGFGYFMADHPVNSCHVFCSMIGARWWCHVQMDIPIKSIKEEGLYISYQQLWVTVIVRIKHRTDCITALKSNC